MNDVSIPTHLRFVTRQRRRRGTWGERRSTRRGAGLEFADYRDYAPGDDPRRVDWNLYARLDRPYVRLYDEEEDLVVSLLLDGSASMAWGEAAARWPMVQRLAVALGSIALLSGDVLHGALLRDTTIAETWPPTRGRGHRAQWRAWIETLMPGGETALGPALRAYAAPPQRPGLVLLLTDGYDPEGLAEGLRALGGRGHEIALLHLLTPEELAPALHGDVQLVDTETGERRAVTLDNATLDAYARRLAAWQHALRALAGRHGGRYALIRTDQPLNKVLLETLRHARILQ